MVSINISAHSTSVTPINASYNSLQDYCIAVFYSHSKTSNKVFVVTYIYITLFDLKYGQG